MGTDDWKRFSPTYYTRLSSAEWKALRERVLKRSAPHCEWCGVHQAAVSGVFQVHHKHYRAMGRESESDLVAVCQHCHEMLDANRDRRIDWDRRLIEHPKRLNSAQQLRQCTCPRCGSVGANIAGDDACDVNRQQAYRCVSCHALFWDELGLLIWDDDGREVSRRREENE